MNGRTSLLPLFPNLRKVHPQSIDNFISINANEWYKSPLSSQMLDLL
jgi:hypothetical protein